MKFNAALAVFLLLAEPGSPFSAGGPATRSNSNRPRTSLTAVPSDIAKYGRKAKLNVVVPDAKIDVVVPDAPVETVTSPGASLGIPDIPDYVPAPIASAPKTNVVNFNLVDTARENYQTTRASIVDSPQSHGEVSPLGEYFRNNAGALKGSVESTATTTYLPEGKAPSLVEFLTNGNTGAGDVNFDALANIKAKLGLMLDNIMSMSGSHATLPAMAGPPSGSVGWIVAGAAILVASGQRSAGLADAKAEMEGMDMNEDTAMVKLSGDMVSTCSGDYGIFHFIGIYVLTIQLFVSRNQWRMRLRN